MFDSVKMRWSIDMSEYMEKFYGAVWSVHLLDMGGYEEGGQLTEQYVANLYL